MFSLTHPNLTSRFLGFDKLFWDIDNYLTSKASAYPFFNVIKTDKGRTVEIAVAGFAEKDISVEYNKSTQLLSISANSTEEVKEKVYSSIASRSFTKTFVLEPRMEIGAVTLKNGILSIEVLDNITDKPEPEVIKLPIKVL